MRYFIELAYNGKNYHGWQRQPNAMTVQERLENTLSLFLREEIAVTGCGRTDTGVHAGQYFAHFDSAEISDTKSTVKKLNSFLPQDIVLKQMFPVHADAHARFDAVSRSYEYRILLRKDPFLTDTVWQIRNYVPDVEKMNAAAAALLKFTDFKCFSRSKTDVKTYDCDVTEARWYFDGELLVFKISADRFLRNMVRAIVGTLLDVGIGKISIDEFISIIESRDRGRAGVSAKARGLFLTEIKYPYELKDLHG